MVGWGREKAEGGGMGCCVAEHQEGRSPGTSAAVQSKPTHHRWFSYTVNKNRTVFTGIWDTERAELEGERWEGGRGEGNGVAEMYDHSRYTDHRIQALRQMLVRMRCAQGARNVRTKVPTMASRIRRGTKKVRMR